MLRYVPLLFAALSVPLALRLAPPNSWYGARTAASMASNSAWYDVNSVTGICDIVEGIVGYAANRRIESAVAGARRRSNLQLRVLVAVALAIVLPGLAAWS